MQDTKLFKDLKQRMDEKGYTPKPDLHRLRLLPNTASLEAELETLKTAERPTSVLEAQLAKARERDAIQATRPEGCWCLGTGGTEARATRQGEEVLTQTCSCPEGQAAKERADQIRDDENERYWRRQREKIWEMQIPQRFRGMRLDTSPLLKAAPQIVGLFRYPAMPDGDRDDGPEWAEWDRRYARWDGSWFLYGNYGTGKTGLAVAYAWEWLNEKLEIEGKTFRFVTVPRLLSELRATYRRGDDDGTGETEDEVLQRYIRADMLILDDLGAEQVKNSGWVEDRLYQVIGERHDEMRPTVFTSNLSLEKLAGHVGERITWRIVEMVGKENIIHLDGPNLRDS